MQDKNISIYWQLVRTLYKAKTGAKFRQQMEAALEEGFSVDFIPLHNSNYKNNTRLLELAIMHRKEEIARYLLTIGADSDIITNDLKLSPLLIACLHNSKPDIIQTLAKKTKNIDAKDNDGHTALGLLCKSYIISYLAFNGMPTLNEKLQKIFIKIIILLESGAKTEIDKSWKNLQLYYYKGVDSNKVISLINDLESRICAYIETKSELQTSTEIGYEYEI